MLDLFKKNNPNSQVSDAVLEDEKQKASQKEEAFQERISKELIIHTMPKKFYINSLDGVGQVSASSGNRFLWFILAFVFLTFLVGVVVYFLMFRDNKGSKTGELSTPPPIAATSSEATVGKGEDGGSEDLKKTARLDLKVEGLVNGNMVPRDSKIVLEAELIGDAPSPLESVDFATSEYISVKKAPFRAEIQLPTDYDKDYLDIYVYGLDGNKFEYKNNWKFSVAPKQAISEQPDQEATSSAFIDADGDGLSREEEQILGSDEKKKDTDGDGYGDKEELIGLYDPVTEEKVDRNKGLVEYKNQDFSYSMLHPNTWSKSNFGGTDSMMFKSADGQFFKVTVTENTDKKSIEDWYAESNGESAPAERVFEQNGWRGIRSADGMNVYLTGNRGDRIFVLTYNTGSAKEALYKNLFDLMVNAFKVN